MGNTFKTAFLLTAMTLLLMIAGRAFGGERGMLMALIFAAIINFVSYFFSDKIALAMYRAQPVSREDLPRVYNIVERLSQKVGLPMPKVYLIPNDSPNAFANGLPVLRLHTTVVSRWLVMPIAAISAGRRERFCTASAITSWVRRQISSGSCSTQPGFG